MKVSRQKLLQVLDSVKPGLSPKNDEFEQSASYVFKDGEVITFNGEVACRAPSPLGEEFTGAVRATALYSILEKLPESEIEITRDKKFWIKAKRKKTWIAFEGEVALPIHKVDLPKKWKPVNEDFIDAVNICSRVAAKSDAKFIFTTVHIHPEWMESSDDLQLVKYKIKTGVVKPILARAESLKAILPLDMSHFAETRSWLHFKNDSGLILSCARFSDPYLDSTRVFKEAQGTGEKLSLPKSLSDSIDRAKLFVKDSASERLKVEVRRGKMRLTGEGVFGGQEEIRTVAYKGGYLSFMISAEILMEIVRRHSDCTIAPDKLIVDGGKFMYLAVLGTVEEKGVS